MNQLQSQVILTLRDDLLTWYDQHGRNLPWRAKHVKDINVYYTVVSEFMLQQTTVKTVIPYFHDFIKKFPTFTDLAQASLQEVMHQWQGLGYYRRAKALWESAKSLAVSYPSSDKDWKNLPGFGPYTIAAVRSMAFQEPFIALDGNINRIMSRIFCDHDMKSLGLKSQQFVHPTRSGDVNQALMDVGSSICLPKNPLCLLCPLQKGCMAYEQGCIHEYPKPKIKKIQPVRYAYAYIDMTPTHIALEQREGTGLLKGLMGVPLSDFWDTCPPCFDIHVKHTFTHFHLYLEIKLKKAQEDSCVWVPLEGLKEYALPTLMKKVIQKAIHINQCTQEYHPVDSLSSDK